LGALAVPGSTRWAKDKLTPPLKTAVNLEETMMNLMRTVWSNDDGQDIAEYAVMLAVILVIVVGTIKLIGTKANTVFSETASSLS
jgi:Flp pilus assembly pilin Flp